MSGDYHWKERRDQVERYRILEQETTDPIAARLLPDIVLYLEAELKRSPQTAPLDAAWVPRQGLPHKNHRRKRHPAAASPREAPSALLAAQPTTNDPAP